MSPRSRISGATIDACVARASCVDYSDSAHVAVQCTEFLKKFRNTTLVVYFDKRLADEWSTHQSRFASRWRVAMASSGRISNVSLDCTELDSKIASLPIKVSAKNAMHKDSMLIGIGAACNAPIVSVDREARSLFAKHSAELPLVGGCAWVDLSCDCDCASSITAKSFPYHCTLSTVT